MTKQKKKFALAEALQSEGSSSIPFERIIRSLPQEQQDDLQEIKRRVQTGHIIIPVSMIWERCKKEYNLAVGLTTFRSWIKKRD